MTATWRTTSWMSCVQAAANSEISTMSRRHNVRERARRRGGGRGRRERTNVAGAGRAARARRNGTRSRYTAPRLSSSRHDLLPPQPASRHSSIADSAPGCGGVALALTISACLCSRVSACGKTPFSLLPFWEGHAAGLVQSLPRLCVRTCPLGPGFFHEDLCLHPHAAAYIVWVQHVATLSPLFSRRHARSDSEAESSSRPQRRTWRL